MLLTVCTVSYGSFEELIDGVSLPPTYSYNLEEYEDAIQSNIEDLRLGQSEKDYLLMLEDILDMLKKEIDVLVGRINEFTTPFKPYQILQVRIDNLSKQLEYLEKYLYTYFIVEEILQTEVDNILLNVIQAVGEMSPTFEEVMNNDIEKLVELYGSDICPDSDGLSAEEQQILDAKFQMIYERYGPKTIFRILLRVDEFIGKYEQLVALNGTCYENQP